GTRQSAVVAGQRTDAVREDDRVVAPRDAGEATDPAARRRIGRAASRGDEQAVPAPGEKIAQVAERMRLDLLRRVDLHDRVADLRTARLARDGRDQAPQR